MKSFLLALLAAPAIAIAEPKCATIDVAKTLSAEQTRILQALGGESNFTICDFGSYRVIVSDDPKSDSIIVIKNGQPFMSYERGIGINLFQDFGTKESVPYVTVQDYDRDGRFERLDYALVDANGKVTGNAKDKTM